MKRILLSVAMLLMFNCLFVANNLSAEEISNGLMTLELNQSIQAEGVSQKPVSIRLDVPDTWSMSFANSGKRNDFIFKHLKNPDKIDISLINLATYFQNKDSKASIINSSINGGENSLKKSAQKLNATYDKSIGVDNIAGKEVNYCLFTVKQKNETDYYKFLYPTSDKDLFIIYAHFKDGAPFQDAEQLINNLVFALANAN